MDDFILKQNSNECREIILVIMGGNVLHTTLK